MKMRIGSAVVAALALAGCDSSAPPASKAATPTQSWEISGLAGPECALPDQGSVYVSNVNGDATTKDGNGFISKVSMDGKTVNKEWVKGLNAPKGLAISDGKLYVGDIDEIVEINLADGAIVAKHAAPGAKLLNDIAADGKGNIYATDTMGNAIYKLSGGNVEEWLRGDEIAGANGVLVEGDNLIVNTWGVLSGDGWATKTPGHMLSISLADKKITDLAGGNPVGNLDGLQSLGNGNYLISDWMAGKVMKFADGKAETIFELGQGNADIGYDAASKTVFVPQMMKGTLHAYKIE
jgi:sugar lactone lactonase YvrE